ncbi:MAG: MFS transporter [Cyanobacteria bacterium P01_E01_bin.42]
MKVFRTLSPSTRRNFLFLFLAGLCFWVSLTVLLPTLPLYIESLGGTQQQVGLVMGSFAIGLLLVRGILGQWADRYSRKLVIQIGAIAVALAPFGYLSITYLPALVVIRAFHGISVAGMTTGYSTLIIELSPPEKRGTLLGAMLLVLPTGMTLGPVLGGYIAEWAGYSVLFLVSGCLGICAAAFASQIREGTRSPIRVPLNKPWNILRSFGRSLLDTLIIARSGEVLNRRALRTPALIMLCVGIAFGSLVTFLPAFIRSSGVDLNPGLFYLASALADFTVRGNVGRASDRFGRGIFITISLMSYLLAMTLLVNAQTIPVFIVAGMAEGIGRSSAITTMVALIADRSSSDGQGQAFALCIGGFDLGMAIGGPLFGSFAPLLGYRGIFGGAAIVVFGAIGLFLTQSSKNIAYSFRFATGRSKDIYALEN